MHDLSRSKRHRIYLGILCNIYTVITSDVAYPTSALRMQWRAYLRYFAHPTLPTFTPQPKWRLPLPRRPFHTLHDTVAAVPSQHATVQSISSDEVEEDEKMAQQELTHLQKLLGLVESRHPVKDVFFVCVDCEAFEHDQTKITEIGISILDSRSIKDVDPGNDGKPWFDLMKHVHLRPIEYKKYVNKNFIKGCPDAFNFGTTDMIRLEDAGRIMTRIFSNPTRIFEACDLTNEIADVEPTIMLVGHALSNDTEYMRRLKFTPKHVSGQIDTQKLARISKKQPPGLTKLLAALSIDAKNLHNAGNDAAYTLQALVGVAVQEHRQPGGVVEILKAEKLVRDAAKAAQKAKAAENAEKRKAARKDYKGKPAQVASKAKFSEISTLLAAPTTRRPVDGSAGSGSNPAIVPGGSKVGTQQQEKLRGELLNMGAHVTGRSDESRREHKTRVRQENSKDGD
ncbi:hypothetical protein Q7P36_001026 [Cladosporium allicinum]